MFIIFVVLCTITAASNAVFYLVEIPDHHRIARSPQFVGQPGFSGSPGFGGIINPYYNGPVYGGGFGTSQSVSNANAQSTSFNQQPGGGGFGHPGFGPTGFGGSASSSNAIAQSSTQTFNQGIGGKVATNSFAASTANAQSLSNQGGFGAVGSGSQSAANAGSSTQSFNQIGLGGFHSPLGGAAFGNGK